MATLSTVKSNNSSGKSSQDESELHNFSDYRSIFNELDVKGAGKVSFSEFEEALKRWRHPFSDKPELIKKIFDAFDSNKDNVIDFEDLKRYLETTDEQILKGFKKIDLDKDGKLDKSDFAHYLEKNLQLNPSDSNVDLVFKQIDIRNDGYVTYDEFRSFLLMMPRLNGSRIRTVFHHITHDLDVSADGDVTLIDQFLNGVGYFLAGGLAGVISRTCTAPFDRVKVFLIARTDLESTVLHSKREIAKKVNEMGPASSPEEARLRKEAIETELKRVSDHKKTIRSPIIQAARTLWKQGGFRAFYVGNGLNVLKVFPESAMKFGSFEATKRFLSRIEGVSDTTQLSKGATYVAGGIGGVSGQIAVYPIDTLKFRLQCSNIESPLKGNALLIQTAKDLYREGGLRIFYRGLFVGVSGIFPYAALDLGTFSSIKKWLIKKESNKTGIKEEDIRLPNLTVLMLGAMSGSFGATVVYPVNLLRTRLQAQGTYAHPYHYDGFYDVLKKTVAKEGYPGLFKGLVPNLAKVAPAVSISYFIYENLKVLFKLDNTVR